MKKKKRYLQDDLKDFIVWYHDKGFILDLSDTQLNHIINVYLHEKLGKK